MARTRFGQVSTIFPEDHTEQVWVAERGSVRQHFGTIEGMKSYFADAYTGYHTVWEETNAAPVERDNASTRPVTEDAPEGEPMHNCSKLVACYAATLEGHRHPTDWWYDTGWRVWREA